MSKITKDQLWKAIIEDLFEDFMHFFFPKRVHEIDFQAGYEFLDQELQTIYPKSESKNRRADKLVKVWLKNGEEKWILIHIEVQGYTDEEFGFRVYSSHYRIRDKFGKPVSVFVLYTDDSPTFHPQEYREECLGTLSLLQFPTYKLLNHPPESHPNDTNNPFSIVMEIAWYELKKNRLKDENYIDIGKKIISKLARQGRSRETIHKMIRFIKYYVTFDKSKNLDKFEEEINIILENKKDMGILELVKQHELEKAEEKGMEKGEEKGKEKVFNVIKLHSKGIIVEEIAQQLKLEVEEVQEIISRMK